ncbi:S8 family peptidase [Conexibacter stalactiti]|uniref:S8 family peptidase n=1 Tax=Conexibacter stalactiti TaxID=1940611 RepID=A0ABU4HXX1_9ACTN|nr:S8 family peptidase [Conexibacter stalactiti]MDW5597320.1 S8 family peptidase [Conexibacter stalactiti]MEC5037962.1 S8 family peptidase [Conexibacter stalactiti]
MPDRLPHIELPAPADLAFQGYGGEPTVEPPSRDRETHAAALEQQIASLEQAWSARESVARAPSARGHVAMARLSPGTDTATVRKLASKANAVVAARIDDGVLIHFRRGDMRELRQKLAQYADPSKDSSKTALPKNAPLINRIESIGTPSLKNLSDGWLAAADIDAETDYTVEIWMPGGRTASDRQREAIHSELTWFLDAKGIHATPRWYSATEREICLLTLAGEHLLELPEACPDVYEIREPQQAIVPHLLEPTASQVVAAGGGVPPNPPVVVAVLDTGIAERHPLLERTIATAGVSVVIDDLSAADRAGHGTRMAGVVAYTDLAGQLQSGRLPQPRAFLQNIRVMAEERDDASIEFWPERMQDAIAAAEEHVAERRLFSAALGAEPDPRERRSVWAIATDQLSYGDGSRPGRLITVPTGNVRPSELAAAAYPSQSLATAMSTPAEAVNAVTVGAITDLTAVPTGSTATAGAGQLSPFSRCDIGRGRPIKPDVVAEGGNWRVNGRSISGHPSVGVLTTSHQHAYGPPLAATCATSAACSSVAGMLAEIWHANPSRRPETIRALLVHSARWTQQMRSQLDDADRLRAVGYGLPDPSRVCDSTARRPTMIVEREIALDPDDEGKRHTHLIELPFPEAVLHGLGATEIEVSVTLSYFTEPNENLVRNYEGFGLRWKFQRPLQSPSSFLRSYNKLAAVSDRRRGTKLNWEIGRPKDKGTVQSDRCRTTAAELASCGLLAVFPVLGWWDGREERSRRSIPYSLVISLDAGEANVDLYSAIEATIEGTTDVETTVEIL